MEMVRIAIKKGVRFDYLLVGSWFTCFEMVKLFTDNEKFEDVINYLCRSFLFL